MAMIKRGTTKGKVTVSHQLLECPSCGHTDVGSIKKCPKCKTTMVLIAATGNE